MPGRIEVLSGLKVGELVVLHSSADSSGASSDGVNDG
jgi:hypothetical protein